MRDRGHQVGAVALQPLPTCRVPQGQRNLHQLSLDADITDSHVKITFTLGAGERESTLRLTGHPRQVAAHPRTLPPVVAPLVEQWQDVGELTAHSGGRRDTGDLDGCGVEHLHPPVRVHHHDPVREIVPGHRWHGGCLVARHPIRPLPGTGQ